MKLDLLLIRLLVVFLKHKLIHTHTHRKCPNGLMLNEVQSFGQQRGVMTNWQPFIEVARSTKDPISLENYSIVVYSVTHKVVKLRALIDLKTANLMQDQSLVVIGDGFFPNKLISIDKLDQTISDPDDADCIGSAS